ncbi:MAG: hypothetical protein H3C49_07530 [Alphaproteobacteria bacterium]|nr:hypothetical protein [Alphaproteobacteria bacterium]
MTEPLSKKFKKNLTRDDAADVIIRALAPLDGGGFAAISFLRERVDYITALGDGVSGLCLKTGVKVPVKMEHKALEEAIYRTHPQETPVLDLMGVTGAVAQDALFPSLRKDFAQEAPAPDRRSLDDVPLRIAFFARQPQQQNFKMCVFDEDAIDWSSVEGHTDGKNGAYTKLKLTYGHNSPFGGKEVMFDMPRPKFMELYNLAKMNGDEELDLRDWTRRRDPDRTPPPSFY